MRQFFISEKLAILLSLIISFSRERVPENTDGLKMEIYMPSTIYINLSKHIHNKTNMCPSHNNT